VIFPKVELINWIEKYSLVEKTYSCPKCGRNFKTTVPVITKECAGLSSRVHECGPGYVGYTLTPRTSASEKFWREIVN